MGIVLMEKLRTHLFALMCSLLLLSACVDENSPQDVTKAFWGSVVRSDAEGVAKYSTLGDAKAYDGFGRDWSGFSPSLGKIIIDGDKASIVTTLSVPGNSVDAYSAVETYLVRQDGGWKVDYDRTGKQFGGGALATLFGQLAKIGSSLSDQFKAASDEFAVKMDRMGEQLEGISSSIGDRASEVIEKYGEDLRRSIEELARSAQQALKAEERQLSDSERRVLEDVVTDLNEGSEQLSRSTLQSIAEGGKALAAARQQLDAIDNEAIEPYKERWREWGERLEADTQKMLDEVFAGETTGPQS